MLANNKHTYPLAKNRKFRLRFYTASITSLYSTQPFHFRVTYNKKVK